MLIHEPKKGPVFKQSAYPANIPWKCSKLFALKCIAYVFGISTNANPQMHKQHSKTTEREMKITNNKGMVFPVIQVITQGLNLPNEPYEIGENV